MTRRVDVAFVPAAFGRAAEVAIVVDLLRASTSLVTMVERGCAPIHLAASIDDARRAAVAHPEYLLVGEEGGLAPSGFQYGNSPVELAAAPLAGRGAVMATTNGAPAIHAATSARVVLVGCLRNAGAVSNAAWEAAGDGGEIVVVCSGRAGNTGGFGLDDAYCAGVLVERLAHMGPAELTDTAEAARLLARAEPEPLGVLLRSAAARNVADLGLEHDVSFCGAIDTSSTVPRLGREVLLFPPQAGFSRFPS